MRVALWPDETPEEHEAGMRAWLARPDAAVFVSVDRDGGLSGFAEAGTRPYVDGCLTTPVAFLEGWYVDPDARGSGVGRALVEAVEQWARSLGLEELASDALLENVVSHRAHEHVGFTEVERAVRYRKPLTEDLQSWAGRRRLPMNHVVDPPTCGKGLAEHSVLPAKLGELTASVADILDAHMKALDLTDTTSRAEHDAYVELAKEHRRIASQLMATAKRMAGYRDLPMGRHDGKAMSSPRARETFEQFVKLEHELVTLLQTRLGKDREMLSEMGGGLDVSG